MKNYIFTLAILIAFLLCLGLPVFAQQHGTIGFSYQQAVDDVSIGVHGDYEDTLGPVDVEVEGQLQSGDLYLGDLDLSVTLGVLRISSDNKLQGDTLAGMGRENIFTGSIVVPFWSNYEVSFGVFGANGNPFTPVYELSNPSDPNSAELKDAGIPIPKGNRWGASLTGGTNFRNFEINGRLLLDPSNVTHQGEIGLGTGGEFWGGVGWSARVTFNAQSHRTDDETVVSFQNATIFGVDLPF